MSKLDKKIWEEKMSVADQISSAINFKTKEDGQKLLKILTNKKAKQICLAKLKLF